MLPQWPTYCQSLSVCHHSSLAFGTGGAHNLRWPHHPADVKPINPTAATSAGRDHPSPNHPHILPPASRLHLLSPSTNHSRNRNYYHRNNLAVTLRGGVRCSASLPSIHPRSLSSPPRPALTCPFYPPPLLFH